MGGLGRWTAALGAIVAELTWPGSSAGASPSPPDGIRLVFERHVGAEMCPDEEQIRAAVEQRLGFDPFDSSSRREIRCTLAHGRGVFRARIQVAGKGTEQNAEREIVSRRPDCAELTGAVALALSIAVKPLFAPVTSIDAASVPVGPAPTPKPAQTSPPESPLPPPPLALAPPPAAAVEVVGRVPIAVPSAAPRTRYELSVGVDGSSTIGMGPGLAPGLGMHVAARNRDLSLELGGSFISSSTAPAPMGSVKAWLWTASVAPCAHRGALAVCGMGIAGALHASSEGLSLPASANVPVVALGARGVFEYPIRGPFRARVVADVAAPLVRAHLTVDDRDVWVSPRVSAALGLGLEATFR